MNDCPYSEHRFHCSREGCHHSRARDTSYCNAHYIQLCATARGGYMTMETARQMVRDGARADDWMAPADDWIAS